MVLKSYSCCAPSTQTLELPLTSKCLITRKIKHKFDIKALKYLFKLCVCLLNEKHTNNSIDQCSSGRCICISVDRFKCWSRHEIYYSMFEMHRQESASNILVKEHCLSMTHSIISYSSLTTTNTTNSNIKTGTKRHQEMPFDAGGRTKWMWIGSSEFFHSMFFIFIRQNSLKRLASSEKGKEKRKWAWKIKAKYWENVPHRQHSFRRWLNCAMGQQKKGAIPKCKSCCVIGPLTCVNGTDLLIERTTKDVSPRKMRELRFYGNGRNMPRFTDPFRSAGRNHLGQIYNVGFVVVVAVLPLNSCENCS